ncbi:hypothetical protein [Streptomyces sp. NPDC055107]
MRNSGDRQARARLARRRPAPRRIRQQTSGARTGWRRLPWVHIGTTAGAIAAIGGLIFTGVATYYSAKIGSDQLQQSREDADRKERSQAEQVSFYVSGEGSAQDVHIINRSLDPIYSPGVSFWAETYDADPRNTATTERWYYGASEYGDLGPCSELVFKASNFKAVRSIAQRRHLFTESAQILTMSFTDRAGKRWYRTPTSLSQKPERDYKESPPGFIPHGYIEGYPEIRDLKVCRDQTP